jgi:type III secretion protein V
VLSIGDALIAQIPALLISLAAGMITTRVSTGDKKEGEESSNIGRDIVTELFREPKALLTAAAIMFLFGLIPGMPTLVFLVLTVLLGGAGAVGLLMPALEAKRREASAENERNNARIVDLMSFNSTRPFIVRMPENMRDTSGAQLLSGAVRVMRNGILETNGIPDLPPVDFEFSNRVPQGRIQFLMAEVPLIDVEMKYGWAASTESVARLTELGLEAEEDGLVGTRRRRVWVKLENVRLLAEANVTMMPWEVVFAADVKVEMLRNCQMFVGVQEALRFTRWADRRFPELGKELAKAVTLPRLSDIIQRLARESVSLRNTRLLLETVLEWSPKERDADTVADYVRLAMKRQLCFEVARDGLIEVVLLSPELEDQLRSAIRQTNQGSYLDLDPELEQTLLDRLSELSGTGGTPALPPVLVTAADLRRSVRKLIEEEFFSVPVFSFSELTQHARVQPVGMIEA